ncbi:hypothetical protein OAB98_00870 [Gammaproteobacteria bacterium]|jgi:hypothetical protein|nr:hypothetical protein [Gammaproteobacteria bacterium]
MAHKTINLSLAILLIFLYFMEVRYSNNSRSYDLIIPWNTIFPSRRYHLNEMKALSAWINRATAKDTIILSDSDYIRYFSKRSLMGANAIPLKMNKFTSWKNAKSLLEDFLESPNDRVLINAINAYGINYIVVPKNFSTAYPTTFSSEAYKIIKVS